MPHTVCARGQARACGHSVLLIALVADLQAGLRAPGGGRGAGGGWGQRHPAGPSGQRVALVESADAVVLVVDVMGDVLQVLEVGAGGWAAAQAQLALVSPGSPQPPGSLHPHRMSRFLRRRNSQCSMFSTARQTAGASSARPALPSASTR